jgi:hypothetical protein
MDERDMSQHMLTIVPAAGLLKAVRFMLGICSECDLHCISTLEQIGSEFFLGIY